MKAEKIYKQEDGSSIRVEIAFATLGVSSDDKCYWAVLCYHRMARCRKWIQIPKSDVPSQWIIETKDELIAKIEASFNQQERRV